MSNEQSKLSTLEFVTYSDTKKHLKAIAEYDFSTRQIFHPQALELLGILVEVIKEARKPFVDYFTYCQYLLMFPKRRNHIAMQILEQPGDRSHVKGVVSQLVNAAVVRERLLNY